MSSEDINLVGKVLIGILNNDKTIRTNASNQLMELSKNLGATSFCLLQIASKAPTTQEENILKTSSLVILRKILDTDNITKWNDIPKDLKEQIKLNSLKIFVNETNLNFKTKIGDVITQILDKISESEDEWEDFKNLAKTLFTFDPTDPNTSVNICSLFKLITDGIGFLFETMLAETANIIKYLDIVLSTSNVKNKIAALNFVSEVICFGEKEEIKSYTPFIFKMIELTLHLYHAADEESLKEIMQIIIELTSVEPKLWMNHFNDLFILTKKIYDKKDFEDEKVRELGFEVIINLLERKPKLIDKDPEKLKALFESIFIYALEMEKDISTAWEHPSGLNYEDLQIIDEDQVSFAESLIERLIDIFDSNVTQPILGELIKGLLSHGDWAYKYVGLIALSNLSDFEKDMDNLKPAFESVFALTKNENSKVRYMALNAINKFAMNFNPKFQKTYINIIIPLFLELFPNEHVLRIQCELMETLNTFIQFTTDKHLKPYNEKLFELIFGTFMKDIPVMLRKQLLECLIEIGSTIEEECTPFALKSFDILIKYFEKCYTSKTNRILFGALIESLSIIGPYTNSTFEPYVPIIVQAIIELIQGSLNTDKDPIRTDLRISLERLLPIVQKSYPQLLPNMIQSVLALVRIQPKMSAGNENSQIDFTDILQNKPDEEENDLHTDDMEDLADSISLLHSIIEALENNILPYIQEIENEILPLTLYQFNPQIRRKATKTLPIILEILTDQNAKTEKGKLYLSKIIMAIEKETDNITCKKMFTYLNNGLDNAGFILNKDEVNQLFQKIMIFFGNLEKKRLKKKEDSKGKKKRSKDDDSDDENINDLIEEELDEIEDILNEINDVIGIIFKTHKDVCDDIMKVILSEVLPRLLRKDASTFETKMALYLTDDMIEYIGQDKLKMVWDNIFTELITLVNQKDNEIRQAAAYGIGIFAQFTLENFDKYALQLINALKAGMKYTPNKSDDEHEKEIWGYAHDNIICAFGKMLYYRQDSTVIQGSLKELIEIWIGNMPIEYDTIEQEKQHGWFTDFVSLKRDIIPASLYRTIFKSLAKIYSMKETSDEINSKINKIFKESIQSAELRAIIDEIYNTSEKKIKANLEKLIKEN